MLGSGALSIKQLIRIIDNHLYLILLVPLILIIFPMLAPGVIMFGDFPFLETSLYPQKFLSTWIDYGSHYGFETLPRYPFIVFGYILNNLGVGADVISKLLVILGFSVASFSFYFSFIFFIRNQLRNYGTFYRIAAIIGSLFYAYNVWSFHRIHHWYLWFGYALFPLFLVLLFSAFRHPTKWQYTIATAFVWSLVSAYPHMVVFYGIFYLGISGFFIIRNIRNKIPVIPVIKPILLILALYILINLYWIYPYTSYVLHSGELINPSIYVTEEYTRDLSADSNLLNVLRLIEDPWQPRIVDVNPPAESLWYSYWFIASFVFPILAFSALLLKSNSKYVVVMAIIGVIAILLTLGTNAPFNIYVMLLFETPLYSTIRFLLREPDKWAFFIALSYSFLMSFASFELLKRSNQSKYKNIIACSFVLLIGLSFIFYLYPVYQSTSQKVLAPIIVPSEYDKLNSFLTNASTERVFYLAQEFNPRLWNEGRYFCCIDEVSSSKPNIDIYLAPSENYHNYIRDSILSKKNENITNLAFPLGTKYLLYSNDELLINNTKLLERISLLKDLRNIKDVGFFKIFKTGEENNLSEFNIPKHSMLLTGGLDMFTSLNTIPSFSFANFSMLFLDQSLKNDLKYQLMNFGDFLVLKDDYYDYIFSFLDEKYAISPHDFTNHGGLSNDWSKDSSLSGIYNTFLSHSEILGMDSWNFDYGKGIAMTETIGANISFPVNIENNDDPHDMSDKYYLFMRYFKNQKGGSVKVLLDGRTVNQANTLDKISNNFKWENIGFENLTEGTHTLVLQNLAGFNAVNLIGIIPEAELNRLVTETSRVLERNIQVVHLLEAESNFYNNRGIDTGYYYNFLTKENNNNGSNTFTKTFMGRFKVPSNADLLSLEFLANKANTNSNYSIKNLQITPAHSRYSAFVSDFEKEKDSRSFRTITQFNWTNNNNDILSVAETNATNSRNKQLNISIKQGDFTRWGVISTDYIPINKDVIYNYTLDVSAKDVKQLHSKVFFFDGNKREIKSSFVSDGMDGTFNNKLTKMIYPPKESKYMQLQIWVATNADVDSSYTLSNVKAKENPAFDWVNYDSDILSVAATNATIPGNKHLNVSIKQDDLTRWGVISTDYIPISENAYYDLSLDFLAKDVKQLHSKVFYFNSSKSLQTKAPEYVFDGIDGSFERTYKKYISPPIGTKYIKLEVLVKANPEKQSSYSLDNVKLDEIIPTVITFNRNYESTSNENYQKHKHVISNNIGITHSGMNDNFDKESRFIEIRTGNTNSTQINIETKPVAVEPDHVYDYKFTITTNNTKSITALAFFKNSDDVHENSKYGNNASNGRVLSMSPGSEVYGRLNIIKPSNYAVVIRAKTCDGCAPLKLSLHDNRHQSNNNSIYTFNYSLNDKQNILKWVYSNSTIPLNIGSYELRINSDSQVDLDSIIVYSREKEKVSGNASQGGYGKNRPESLEEFFNQELYPAKISGYSKINPTKYVVNITNATGPYIMSFAEGYDNLWIANIENSDDGNNESSYITNSIPLYSFINGYFINKSGDYSVSLEYQPQKWFIEAGFISLFTALGCLAIFLFSHRLRGLKYAKSLTRSLQRDSDKDKVH